MKFGSGSRSEREFVGSVSLWGSVWNQQQGTLRMVFMHGVGSEHKWLSEAAEAFERYIRADLPANSNFAR